MNSKVRTEILSSILVVLIGFAFTSSLLDYSVFAQNLNVSAADSTAAKIQKEKAEEERKKSEEQKSSEDKKELGEEKRNQTEKDEERTQKLEEKREELEEKREKLKQREIEKAQEIEEKFRKKIEEHQEKINLSEESSLEDKVPAKLLERKSMLLERFEEIKQNLLQKIDEKKIRLANLLEKAENAKYIDPSLYGGESISKYVIHLDGLTAKKISDKEVSAKVTGEIEISSFNVRNSNIKFITESCLIAIDSENYSCLEGKGRTISSGDGGEKDSLVIVSFLHFEEEEVNQIPQLLKIFVKGSIPIIDIQTDSIQVEVLSPQSKITHKWFIGGDATIEKIADDQEDEESKHITIELKENISMSDQ